MKTEEQRCNNEEFDVFGAPQKLARLTGRAQSLATLVSLWSSVFEMRYDEYSMIISVLRFPYVSEGVRTSFHH